MTLVPEQVSAHIPAWQTSAAPHVMPHAPQFAGSSFVSAQKEESPFVHFMSGAAHVASHMPALHTSPAPHAVAHAPQFALSCMGSTQVMPHSICPVGQPWSPASGDMEVAAVPHAATKSTRRIEMFFMVMGVT
jgi:hypothetical protein